MIAMPSLQRPELKHFLMTLDGRAAGSSKAIDEASFIMSLFFYIDYWRAISFIAPFTLRIIAHFIKRRLQFTWNIDDCCISPDARIYRQISISRQFV